MCKRFCRFLSTIFKFFQCSSLFWFIVNNLKKSKVLKRLPIKFFSRFSEGSIMQFCGSCQLVTDAAKTGCVVLVVCRLCKLVASKRNAILSSVCFMVSHICSHCTGSRSSQLWHWRLWPCGNPCICIKNWWFHCQHEETKLGSKREAVSFLFDHQC